MATGGVTLGTGLAAAFVLLAAAPAAHAAPAFVPPAGCTLSMTVQQRSCTVAQHYTCAADKPGDQRVDYFTRDGLVYQSRIDAETRWMESTDPVAGLTDRLEPEAPDHASFAILLKTGKDDYEFWTVSDSGQRLRYSGGDQLTGEKVVIDGVPLELTVFAIDTYDADGALLNFSRGQQYISREHGRFYGGFTHTNIAGGKTIETEDSPVRFIRPGQPGFASIQPQYDCDLLTASLAGAQR